MCYPPVDQLKPGAALPDDFPSRTGYRLPTEAEWELAARAGTVTTRFFGETDQWLSEYAWYDMSADGHLWPVGSLKPNPLGFFDVYGNVSEWCHDPFDEPSAPDGAAALAEGGIGVVRGGAFKRPAGVATSMRRERFLSDYGASFVGFRVARTIAQ